MAVFVPLPIARPALKKSAIQPAATTPRAAPVERVQPIRTASEVKRLHRGRNRIARASRSARGLVPSTELAGHYLRCACRCLGCRLHRHPHRRVGNTRLLGGHTRRSVCSRDGTPRGRCLLYAPQKPCRGAGYWGRRNDHHLRGHARDDKQPVGELAGLSPNLLARAVELDRLTRSLVKRRPLDRADDVLEPA